MKEFKETQDRNFVSFPCNHCGWCCQRTPCALGVYMGAEIKGPCRFLIKEGETSACGLIRGEDEPLKKAALLQLILADEGCTHKFGPHPVSLLKTLLNYGLQVGSPQWEEAKNGTRRELALFAQQSSQPESLHQALVDFEDFCAEMEVASRKKG